MYSFLVTYSVDSSLTFSCLTFTIIQGGKCSSLLLSSRAGEKTETPELRKWKSWHSNLVLQLCTLDLPSIMSGHGGSGMQILQE